MKKNIKKIIEKEEKKFDTKEIIELLGIEKMIEIKKQNKIELEKNEKLMDEYMLKPSTLVRMILKRTERREKND